jgi:hypothetical protein
MRTFKYIAFGIFILYSISIFPETILLIGKETIKGKVKNQNANSVEVDVEDKIVKISKERILKIVYRDLTKEEEKKIREEEERKLAERQKKSLPQKEESSSQKEEIKSTGSEGTEDLDKKKKMDTIHNRPTRLGVTARSSLLPGWGQYIEKRFFAAGSFAFLIIGGSIVLYNENKHYRNSLNDYNTMSNPPLTSQFFLSALGGKFSFNEYSILLLNNQKQAVVKNYQDTVKISYALAAVYILNIIDVFLFYNSDAFTENKERGFLLDYQTQALSREIPIIPKYTVDGIYNFGYQWKF